MKIKQLRFSGSVIPDNSFSFHDHINLIYGENGSGKSLVCSAILDSFLPAVSNKKESSIPGKSWQIDYSIKNEICTVCINNGKIDQSRTLKKYASINIDSSESNNIILGYGRSRLNGDIKLPSSVRTFYGILSDLHKKKTKDSVVVIDDFDLGISEKNSKDLLSHIYKNYSSRNCQIIVSSSSIFMKKIVQDIGGKIIELDTINNVLESAIKSLH